MAVKRDFLVEKRNVLNEIRTNNMTMQELRFFSIYLSKINARDPSTRIVRFPLDEFARIMEFGSRININYMKSVTNSLLGKVVNVRTETGGYIGFQLFKECTVDHDETGEWYVEIDAHDRALPLMFDFKRDYFSYELWNALRLRSSNQIILYELLKQYEKVGERIIAVDRLRERLGLGSKEYPRFNDFKIHVLDVCQAALKEHTDLSFTYEPYGKRGAGGKILTLKFTIEKNANYIDQLTLFEFIAEQEPSEVDVVENIAAIEIRDAVVEDLGYAPSEDGRDHSNPYIQRIDMLIGACDDEFSFEQIELLHSLMTPVDNDKIVFGHHMSNIECYHHLMNLYIEMNARPKGHVKNRFRYLAKMVKDYEG